MNEITVTERDHDCVFTLTVVADEDVVAQVYDDLGDDITRDELGNLGPVTMTRNGDGTYSGVVSVCDIDGGEKITFVVSKLSDPGQPMTRVYDMDHDCHECEEAVTELAMPVAAFDSSPPPLPAATPTPAARARTRAKPKPIAKTKAKRPTKAKAKTKAKTPKKKAAKKAKKAKAAPKKRKAPVARKKAKPAKKKPPARKKKR